MFCVQESPLFGFPVESWNDLKMLITGTLRTGKYHLNDIDWMIRNIALFVPFGFLLRGNCVQARNKRIIQLGFLCSLSIEMLQMVCWRGRFDVDDILFNTLGAYLGVRLYAYALRECAAE